MNYAFALFLSLFTGLVMAQGPTLTQRIAAATSAAKSTTNACKDMAFYWEIGDRSGKRASGTVTHLVGDTVYLADTEVNIASATKWVYGAYVAQRRGGVLTAADIRHLGFRSGFVNFTENCNTGQTVDECLAMGTNGYYTGTALGKFYYDGGHMQKHASSIMGLGDMKAYNLTYEIKKYLGSELPFRFTVPQLEAFIRTTPSGYAMFLRKMLNNQLFMGQLLGSNPICTNPITCPDALFAPMPEDWHYSMGHWVEDSATSDGAFSSAGGFGFYPWIDVSRTYYGILSRQVIERDPGWNSSKCGRAIRNAWITGASP